MFTSNKTKNSVFLLAFYLALNLVLPSSSWAEEPTSLYEFAGSFTDDSGKAFELKSLTGKITFFTMSYVNCRKTCPKVTFEKLKEIQKEIQAKKLNAEIVILSFDPESDTPEAMRMFRNHRDLHDSNWHFLRTDAKTTRAFAKLLKLDDYYQMDDHILHSFRIVGTDSKGRVQNALDWDHQDVKVLFK